MNNHFNAKLYDDHCDPIVKTPLYEQYLSHLLMVITPSRWTNNYYWFMPLIISTQTFVDQVLKSDKVSSPSTICQSMNTQQILVSSTQILPIHRRDTSQIIEIVWDIVNDSLKRKSSAQLKLKKNESDKHKFTKQKVMTSRIPQLRKSAI
ncbi:hypothetical protein PV325_013066 [Microctonus aethiopoides]|nr:hypothetical protein PV325_013066 [Microctonus aethiopoides]